jgi:hypothetical protein
MTDQEREGLRAAIESLHNCRASFSVSEIHQARGEGPEFTREVATFTLNGHPTAPLAYAWSDVRGHRTHHRVVLHSGGITSASEALTGFLLFAWDDAAGP